RRENPRIGGSVVRTATRQSDRLQWGGNPDRTLPRARPRARPLYFRLTLAAAAWRASVKVKFIEPAITKSSPATARWFAGNTSSPESRKPDRKYCMTSGIANTAPVIIARMLNTTDRV